MPVREVDRHRRVNDVILSWKHAKLMGCYGALRIGTLSNVDLLSVVLAENYIQLGCLSVRHWAYSSTTQ